jgi:Clp amino terminal domain, pathogenicity island component
MSPLNVNLADVINQLEQNIPDATDLDRISEAQRRAHTLTDVGEQLVGYYVTRAKNAGASWSQIGDAIGVSKQAVQQRWTPQTFERFTDRARHVVVLSQEAARERLHHHIGTEHIALGLLGEPKGLAYELLVERAGSAEAVAAAVEGLLTPGTENSPAKIPFTPRGKQVLEEAVRESNELGHDFVGTEHLLLGLLVVEEGLGARALAAVNVDITTLRPIVEERVKALLADTK